MSPLSTKRRSSCRVPQSSVLGPLLFLVYINDLPNIPQHSECILYADDTYIFGTLNETKELKTDLELISEWMESNNFTTNKGKTQIIIANGIKKLQVLPGTKT